MKLLLVIYILLLAELLLVFTPLWNLRRYVAFPLAILTTIFCLSLAFMQPCVGSYLLVAINCYRVINIGRMLENRQHASYLLHSARRTSWSLLVATLLVSIFVIVDWTNLAIIAVSSSLAALVFFASSFQQTRKTTPRPTQLTNAQLPTVTVAIPAKDETSELLSCLDSILASDYPKLEILVLDDNSRGKAAEVIREFAHDGVRFIPGDKPRKNWLAKNQAYQRLAHEANGQILLFCGVDIRLQPQSIRQMVGQLESRNKQMLCVVPENRRAKMSLIQPMRYAWELALPRRLLRRPAVLSSCWLIKRDALKSCGGFAAVTRMIVPEAYFARELIKHDGYSFLRSTKLLGVSSEKPTSEQEATAIRTRYPQHHKRPELVLTTSIIQLICIVLPVPAIIYALVTSAPLWVICMLAVAIVLDLLSYRRIVLAGHYRATWSTTLLLPVASLVDIWLCNKSMWQYEFAEVYWKGRPITNPVMHVTPHLPKP